MSATFRCGPSQSQGPESPSGYLLWVARAQVIKPRLMLNRCISRELARIRNTTPRWDAGVTSTGLTHCTTEPFPDLSNLNTPNSMALFQRWIFQARVQSCQLHKRKIPGLGGSWAIDDMCQSCRAGFDLELLMCKLKLIATFFLLKLPCMVIPECVYESVYSLSLVKDTLGLLTSCSVCQWNQHPVPDCTTPTEGTVQG